MDAQLCEKKNVHANADPIFKPGSCDMRIENV